MEIRLNRADMRGRLRSRLGLPQESATVEKVATLATLRNRVYQLAGEIDSNAAGYTQLSDTEVNEQLRAANRWARLQMDWITSSADLATDGTNSDADADLVCWIALADYLEMQGHAAANSWRSRANQMLELLIEKRPTSTDYLNELLQSAASETWARWSWVRQAQRSVIPVPANSRTVNLPTGVQPEHVIEAGWWEPTKELYQPLQRCAIGLGMDADTPENLLAASDGLDASPWAVTAATVSKFLGGGIVAPWDSDPTKVFQIDDASGAGPHEVHASITAPDAVTKLYTFSVCAKKATGGDFLTLYVEGATPAVYAYRTFNINTGVLGTTAIVASGMSIVSATIESQGGGWYRCIVTVRIVSPTTLIFKALAATATDGFIYETGSGKKTYLANAQVRRGTAAGTYVPTTGTAVVSSLADFGGTPLRYQLRSGLELWPIPDQNGEIKLTHTLTPLFADDVTVMPMDAELLMIYAEHLWMVGKEKEMQAQRALVRYNDRGRTLQRRQSGAGNIAPGEAEHLALRTARGPFARSLGWR